MDFDFENRIVAPEYSSSEDNAIEISPLYILPTRLLSLGYYYCTSFLKKAQAEKKLINGFI